MTLFLCAWGLVCSGCASSAPRVGEPAGAASSIQHHRAQAERLRRAGQFDEAIAAYQALSAEPSEDRSVDADLRHQLSLAYWERAGRTGGQGATAETLAADRESAIRYANDALVIAESAPEGRASDLYGRVGRSLGRYLRGSNRLDEAIEFYTRLLNTGSGPAVPAGNQGVDQAWLLHELANTHLDRAGREGGPDRQQDLAAAQQRQTEALETAGRVENCPASLRASIDNSLGLIHRERLEVEQAAQRFAEADRILGEQSDSSQRAEVLSNLIPVLVEAGRYDDVRQRCAVLEELPAAASDPRIMAVLGLAKLELGDYSEAAQHFDLARHVARQDAAYRADLTFQAQLATNAASCAQALGAYDDAERYLTEALAELEAGRVDPRTSAVVQANLGRMYLTVERLDEAEEQLAKVLAVMQDLQGPQHPDTLLLQLDLANLARLRGYLVEAQQQCEAALQGLIQALGEDHPTVARARLELASLHREQGRCAEALAEAGKAMEALDARLGPNHKEAVLACLQVALLAADCHETEEGAATFRRLRTEAGRRFAALKEALGPKNVEVLRAMVYFADVTARTPEARAEALERYREAEQGFAELYGEGTPSLAALRLKQGRLLETMGDTDEALRVYNRAVRLLDRSLERHVIRAELLTAMGDIYNARGDQDAAKRLWRDAFRILTATYGADHPRVKDFYKQRGG